MLKTVYSPLRASVAFSLFLYLSLTHIVPHFPLVEEVEISFKDASSEDEDSKIF